MATTYTSRTSLRKPALGDRTWSTPVNENADLLDAFSALGGLCVTTKENPSTTLNVKVAAGSYRLANDTVGTYAGTASFAITASSTLNVWLTDAGTLTSGAAWPGTAHVRLATVVSGTSTITSVTDARIPFGSAGVAVTTAPPDATYIVQTANATLTAEQALSSLSTGIVKVTTGTGVLSTAVAGTDYQAADVDLTALAAIASNGVLCHTGAGTAAARTITGTANQVVVTNGDGASGNPTLSTPQSIHTAATPTFGGLTIATSGIALNGGGMTIAEAGNVAVGTTTGTKIGTATTQKLGFYNKTPVIQPAAGNQAAIGDLTGGSVGGSLNDVGAAHSQSTLNNNFATILALLNQLRTDLVALGLIKGSA